MKTNLIAILAVFCGLATCGLKAQTRDGQGVEHEPRTRAFAPNTCTLFADSVAVWLWVFEELEPNSNHAFVVYDGKLERGRKQVVSSGTDRIRYTYKTSAADEMHGNIGAWCYKGNTIRVP